MERRLAAILAADVVDYSRLMGEDQDGMLSALKSFRADLLTPSTERHQGRLVKNMGDGWLLEFPSIADAVSCGMDVQLGLMGHGQIKLRVGIHIGDVVFDEEDVFGDGVNIAGRLEELASPGEILVSDTAHQSLDGKAAGQFEGGELHQLKNIARPVAIWRWHERTALGEANKTVQQPPPDKPSIAVLPFDNMSGDPEQEYFADAITEDIITELSRYRGLMVIARNSSFTYKGKPVATSKVGRELGVRYILEGSIRKAGNRVRVTAQLIDAERGDHIWAERFDRVLEDIFAVQDEITQIVTGTLAPKLETVSGDRVMNEDPQRLGAYDLVLRALVHWNRFSKEDHEETDRLVRAAIDLDPSYSRAYSVLAHNLCQIRNSGYSTDPEESLHDALRAAQMSVSLDDNDAQAHHTLAMVCMFSEQLEQAIAECHRALELNPNFADAHMRLANVLAFSGRVEEARSELEIAMRLNPHYPPMYLMVLGRTCYLQGSYVEAIEPLERVINIAPGLTPSRTVLAACYQATGREDDAAKQIEELLKKAPTLTQAHVNKVTPIKDDETRKQFVASLGQAGLPGDGSGSTTVELGLSQHGSPTSDFCRN